MRTIYYQEQDEILQKAYLNRADIQRLVPISTKEAYKLIKEIVSDMDALGIPRFNTRQKLVPTSMVIKKLQLAKLERE